MTESKVVTPTGMHTITPHIGVSDAARAADWYREVLGAEERSRIEVPGGKLMQAELWFGDSAVMLADEFPELGVLSPLSVGGTATVLHLYSNDVDALWNRAIDAGAEVRQPLQDVFRERALRSDHRPLRPPLGPCTALARRPATGD
jgi:PhnB protein